MATDLERLVVTLEAKLTQYEKSMNKALGISNARAKAVEARWAKLSLPTNAFAGFAKGAIAGLIPVLSLGAAINGAKDALKEFGDIADNSKAAGLDPELFQGLTYQAGLVGVSFEQAAGALQVFAKNSGLAVEGKGKMVAALKALNPELLENIRAATTQEERVRLAAEAIKNAGSASERAAISAALFGDAGVKMADAFSGGAGAIDATMQKAKALGIIVDRELIARADTLGDEFETATKVLDLQFKQVLVELAPILVSIAGGVAQLVRELRNLGNVEFKAPSLDQLKSDLKFWEDKSNINPMSPEGLLKSEEEWQHISDRIREVREQIQALETTPHGTGAFPAVPPSLTPPAVETPPNNDVQTLDEIEANNAAATAAIKHADAVKELIADLEFERKIAGLSAVDQEVLTATRRAGVDVLSEEGLRIRELITLEAERRDEIEKTEAATKAWASAAEEAGRNLVKAFEDGKLEGKELLSILFDVVKQMALSGLADAVAGGNIGASLLSGILSGFAGGTADTGGTRGQVRGVVHGREAVIPLPGGGKVPVELRVPALSAANGNSGPVRVEVLVGVGDDGKLVAIARQAGGEAAAVTVRQLAPGMVDSAIQADKVKHARRRT